MRRPGLLACMLCLALLSDAWAQTPPGTPATAEQSAGEPGAAPHHRSAAVRRMERSLERVHPLLKRYGYGAAVVAVLVEGVGIPLPGQTLLMASSLEASAGRMNIVLILLFVTAAAVVGNSIGYAIGRWFGRAALARLRVNQAHQQHLQSMVGRRGGLVILVARFVDGLRQLNGIVAGILQMPWWSFTAYNVAGAILWTSVWGLGIFYLGRDFHVIVNAFHRPDRLVYWLSVIALAALVAYVLRREMRGDDLGAAQR